MSGRTIMPTAIPKSVLVVLDPCEMSVFLELDVGEEEAQARRLRIVEAIKVWPGPLAIVEHPELHDDFSMTEIGDAFRTAHTRLPLGDALFVETASVMSVVGPQGLLHHIDEARRQELVDEILRARLREGAARVVERLRLKPGRDRVSVTGCYANPEGDGACNMLKEDLEALGFQVELHASVVIEPTEAEKQATAAADESVMESAMDFV